MHFPISYAGFFAKSHIMFFLLSSFRFLPPLKNDGTRGLRLNTCLSFLNEVKNLAKVRDIKCVFLYPRPDSSLLITICFLIFHFFMYACHRSRMTARVMCFLTVLKKCPSFLNEVKNPGREYRY